MDNYLDLASDFDEEWQDGPQKSRKAKARQKPSPKTVTARFRQRTIEDLKPLFGAEIEHLPRDYWCAGCLFFGLKDEEWQERTAGAFPARVKNTHPLYVLSSCQLQDIVCPASTKPQSSAGILPAGSRLEVTDRITTVDSYILYKLSFCLAPEDSLESSLSFQGVFPFEKLVEASV